MTYKIKKNKELIKKLRPFWKRLQELNSNFRGEVYELEKEMEKDTGIKDIEFFMCDNSFVGIGNADRTMQLVHDRELE